MMGKCLSVLLMLLLVGEEICTSPTNGMDALQSKLDGPLQETSLLGNMVKKLGKLVFSLTDVVGLESVNDFLNQVVFSKGRSPVIKLTDDLEKTIFKLRSNATAAFSLLFNDVGDVLTALKTLVAGRLTCAACLPLVTMIKLLLAGGTSEDDIGEFFIQICSDIKVATPEVCRGTVKLQQHMLLYSAKNTPYNVPEICAFLVGNGCGEEPEEGEWKVVLPPKPQAKNSSSPTPSPVTGKMLKFVHLTDPHVDNNYTVGSPSACSEPLCCRNSSSASQSNITAGRFGGALYCDLPFTTLRAIFQHIKETQGHIDGIFWTGDQPPHNVWTETVQDHMFYNEAVDNLLKQFFPDARVYPAIGNHDSAPANNFPIESPLIQPSDNVTWLYNQAWSLWKGWLPDSAEETVKRAAYYSVETDFPGLRVVSLNNIICYFANWWLLINATDPLDQLAFLIQELTAAELAGEKVILLLHIPPGSDDCLRVWSSNLYDIVNRFADTIVCQVSGHTHWDSFMVYYDEDGSATNVMHVSPSLTTYENFNVGFKVFLMNGNPPPSGSYEILDILAYYMPLEISNSNGDAMFQFLYSTKNAYDMKSMAPAEWNEVIRKIRSNTTYWNRFYENYSRKSLVYPACDDACKEGLICQLMRAKSRDESLCNNPTITGQ